MKLLRKVQQIKRWLFPSPAEKMFMKVMGFGFFLLHDVKREHKAEGYYIDFALLKPQHIAIEIDGKNFHGGKRDIVRDFVLEKAGWNVLRIPATELWQRPRFVRQQVKLFVRNPEKWKKRYG